MAIGGIFQFIGSNSLTFVRTEDILLPQNDANRLYGDYHYASQYFIPYAQKYEQKDSLSFQLRTNYSEFTAYVVSQSGVETQLSAIKLSTDADDYDYYNVSVDISVMSGCYYVRTVADSDEDKVICNFTSNYFQVAESYPNTLLVEWYGNSSYDDGYVWLPEPSDIMQSLRLDAIFIDNLASGNINTMIDSDNNISQLNYKPAKRKLLHVDSVPDYICLLLNRVIGHDLIVVNGQLCDADDIVDYGERKGDSQMYEPTVELQLRDYENYNKLIELEGELPVLPTVALQFDTGIALQFDTGIGLRFQ